MQLLRVLVGHGHGAAALIMIMMGTESYFDVKKV